MSSHDASDTALLEAWRLGEAGSGVQLIQRHYAAVFSFFASKVCEDEAAELTQDAFIGLTEARERFRSESSVRTFVFGIARLKLLEHFRKTKSHRDRLNGLENSKATEASTGLLSWLEGRRQESLLVTALRSLPLDDQILLELKGYEELTTQELSDVFDVPTGTIASRIRRARTRLEQEIRALADAPGLAQETVTGLNTYMQAIRASSRHPG